MKDLQPYPNGGLGPLTEAEQRIIDDLSVGDALDITISLVRAIGPSLATLTNEDHAAARAVGFEDAVHDMLTFIGSDWFDLIVDAATESKSNAGTPLQYAQAIVDNALGEGVLEAVEIEPEEPVWWRSRPPRGHKYGPVLLGTAPPGTCVVGAYETRVRGAQEEPELIVLELPGYRLAIEVNDGDALCDAQSAGHPGGPGRPLEPRHEGRLPGRV